MLAARLKTLIGCEIEIRRFQIRLVAALALALDDGPDVTKITGVGAENSRREQKHCRETIRRHPALHQPVD
jgi:hypothetical protein